METNGTLMNIPLAKIYPNPDQPRKEFDEEKLNELAASIKQYGVLEPIVVTPREDRYMIIAGERRFRASVIACLPEISAKVIEADDAMVEELALIENVQRQDLNPIEEGRAYKKLSDRMTTDEIAKNIGFTVRRVEERLRLLNLAPEFQKMVVDGTLTLGCSTRGLSTGSTGANELSKLPPDKQTLVYSKIREGQLNTYSKIQSFMTALALADQQGGLFEFTEITPEERKEIDHLESLLRTAEKLAFVRSENLKKAALHSPITLDRIDTIIAQLYRIRKLIGIGQGVKTVMDGCMVQTAEGGRPCMTA